MSCEADFFVVQRKITSVPSDDVSSIIHMRAIAEARRAAGTAAALPARRRTQRTITRVQCASTRTPQPTNCVVEVTHQQPAALAVEKRKSCAQLLTEGVVVVPVHEDKMARSGIIRSLGHDRHAESATCDIRA